jgi:hypothetical protein
MEDRSKAIDFLNEAAEAGLPMKAIADLFGVCRRTLRRWGLDISGQCWLGMSPSCKGSVKRQPIAFVSCWAADLVERCNGEHRHSGI